MTAGGRGGADNACRAVAHSGQGRGGAGRPVPCRGRPDRAQQPRLSQYLCPHKRQLLPPARRSPSFRPSLPAVDPVVRGPQLPLLHDRRLHRCLRPRWRRFRVSVVQRARQEETSGPIQPQQGWPPQERHPSGSCKAGVKETSSGPTQLQLERPPLQRRSRHASGPSQCGGRQTSVGPMPLQPVRPPQQMQRRCAVNETSSRPRPLYLRWPPQERRARPPPGPCEPAWPGVAQLPVHQALVASRCRCLRPLALAATWLPHGPSQRHRRCHRLHRHQPRHRHRSRHRVRRSPHPCPSACRHTR